MFAGQEGDALPRSGKTYGIGDDGDGEAVVLAMAAVE